MTKRLENLVWKALSGIFIRASDAGVRDMPRVFRNAQKVVATFTADGRTYEIQITDITE